jgi:hypothetical protein
MMKPTKPATLYAWAERKFRRSNSKDIRLVHAIAKKKWMGEYEWKTGIITLNLTWIKSSPTLYKTLAHEWTHAQQLWRDYKYYDARFPYKEHPLELEAKEVERGIYPKR